MLAKKCLLVGILTLLSVSLAIADPPAVHPTTGEPLVIDCLRGTPDAIDGDLSDWNLEAMTPAVLDVVEQLNSGQDSWDGPEDCSGEFYLLWDDENIYIAAVVKDDALSMNKSGGDIWNADAIEVFFSTTNAVAGHAEHYQYGFNANNQRWNWCNMDGAGSTEPDYLQIASSVTADGYICEASISYGQMLSLDFSAGNTIGFHPVFDDTDNGDTELQMTWTGREAHDQSLGFGHMVLSADSAAEPEAPSSTIIWVSFHGADDAPSDAAAAVGFTEASDKGYTDLLTANGYNVTRYITSSTPDPEVLNAADLVIIGRAVSSGGYSNDGATAWNNISAPMIIMGGYVLRSSRMGYTTGTNMPDTTGDITLTVSDPTHPIFAGIPLTDGTMVNPYAGGAVVLPTDGTTVSRGISINNDPADDEGTILATIAEASADTGPVGGMVIAEWPAGATLTHAGGAETDVLAGHRLVFLSGSREPDGVTGGDAAGLYDLYPDGEKMLLNAVSYMIPVKLLDVTAPGDAIQGVPNDGDWPGAETPDLAIDDDTSTKFLHFKGELEPTGFQVTPAAGASIVTGLTLTTANDAIERDPVTFKLSGSNESIDGPYELIASGDIVDFAQADAWPRFTMNATPISFYNDVAYAHYQVLFPAVRDAGSANSMQIAEVELLGELYVDPDIAAINELYNQATLACGTGDVELYLSIFTEDAVVMTPGRPAFIGKEVLRAAMEGLFGLFDLGLPYTVDEVGVPGDWAFVRSSFQYSMTPKEGGETTTNPGKQLDILKRQADGSWNVYNECWNYGATPTAAKMAGTSWGPGLAKMAQEDDADAIYREMCDLYTLAVETGDTDLYVANYTDDGVQMPPDEPSRIGSEQIRAGIEPALALFNAECPIYPKEAVITGDWAFGRCDWSLSLTPKEGGPTTTFNGKGTDVLKRQADGSWKYYISCWNYNGPPIVEE